jgi:hypothetical protein
MNRAEALAGAWLYVGAGIVATALLRGYMGGGFETSGTTGLFLGGALLLVFGIRDVFLRENREMERHQHNTAFLVMTVAVIAIVTYSLATAAAGVL